ncbi:MAG: EF-hand domain-containing protein [Planctomycetota bacterium]|nr:EF-hand domain-containing protein [Planctomycetota bacterium]
MSTDSPEKSKPLISLPFIIFAAVLLIVGAVYGQSIMTWFMLQGEAAKANQVTQPDEFADLSAWAKSLQDDPSAAPPSSIGVGGAPGGGESNRPDPEERFAEYDANEDGKLTGDEIQGRLVEFIDRIDTDADGEITKEEYMTAIENMRSGGGRGGPGGRGGRPSGRGGRPASEADEGDANSNPEEKPAEKTSGDE